MTDIIAICSAALIKIGASAIQSLNDNQKEAQVAKVLYPVVRDSELSNYPWQFAGAKIELNLLPNPPLDKTWKYAYQIPNDVFNIRSAFGTSGCSVEYFVEENVLYTSVKRVFLSYTQDVPEVNWPPYFVDVMIARLAFEFGIPVIGIGSDEDRAMKEYGAKHHKAKRIDANTNQPDNLISPTNSSLVRARFGYN